MSDEATTEIGFYLSSMHPISRSELCSNLQFNLIVEPSNELVSVNITMKKLTLFFISFRLSCLGVFLYQAWNLIEEYSKQNTITDVGFTKLDRFPFPNICVTTKIFSSDFSNKTLNITADKYLKGEWKVDGMSERETWDFLSPNLTDLIEKIEVDKMLKNIGGKYIKVSSNVENLSSIGVDIERKDYYLHPRIFCLIFRNVQGDLFDSAV